MGGISGQVEGESAVSLSVAGIKAVIYDCDGVMFDSIEANCVFYGEIFRQMGMKLDRHDPTMMRIIHTFANREVLKYYFPDEERFAKALQIAQGINYTSLVPLMKMEDELETTLAALKGRVHLAVCTNRSSSMDAVLAEFRLADYFSFVMTAAKASFPKPHPDPLNRILAHFNLKPEEALFVGDSALDAEASAAASVPFVAYKSDLYGERRIKRHGELLALLA
jgi:HAD superfamily hydrolase (TIGR01509 family)